MVPRFPSGELDDDPRHDAHGFIADFRGDDAKTVRTVRGILPSSRPGTSSSRSEAMTGGGINTAWPNTDGDEWCGEFVELHDEADEAETTSSPNRSSTCCCRMTTMPRRARRTGSDDA